MVQREIVHLERLNRRLLDCAASGRWDELRQLEGERRVLLQRLLRQVRGREAAAYVQRAIDVDRVIVRLGLRRPRPAGERVRRAAG